MPPAIMMVLEEMLPSELLALSGLITPFASSIYVWRLMAYRTHFLPIASGMLPAAHCSQTPENLMIPPTHLSGAQTVFPF